MNQLSEATLDGFLATGDQQADAYVQALLGNAGNPAALQDLSASLGAGELPSWTEVERQLGVSAVLPAWADLQSVARAQDFFEREYQDVMTVLGYGALPESYCNAGVARMLRIYSALGADPSRRVERTAEFVTEVMGPGGLADGAPGRRAILRVRLLHGVLRASPGVVRAYAGRQWEAPLNQEDMAGTLLTLGWLTAIRLTRLGREINPRTAYDYAHTWNLIGWLMGVDARLLPRSGESAAWLAEAIRRRRYRATPEGRALAHALLQMHQKWAPGIDGRAMVRRLLGDELSDMIAV